ncbi:MAG: hypothetical protein QM579_08115 [Desulfovibrio sp.]|uniref:hypothetical protein n=1 Tax=Desulfovibrio sp. TaxID=885 RepID=UPI0039E26271
MSYKNAGDVFPHELLCKIQEYINGEYIYIPRQTLKNCLGVSCLEQEKRFRTETGRL